MGRTESLNLKNDYERACGWYGHFNKSEMALFSECTDRYVQKLLDTADIVREAMFRQRSDLSANWGKPQVAVHKFIQRDNGSLTSGLLFQPRTPSHPYP